MRPPTQWMDYSLHVTSKVRRCAVSPYGTVQNEEEPFVDVELQRLATEVICGPDSPLAEQIYGEGRTDDWVLICCGCDRRKREWNGVAVTITVAALLLLLIVFAFGLIGAIGHKWGPGRRN